MKVRTKVRAGGVNLNHNAKKLTVKQARGGVVVKSAVKAGKKGA